MPSKISPKSKTEKSPMREVLILPEHRFDRKGAGSHGKENSGNQKQLPIWEAVTGGRENPENTRYIIL